MSREACRREGPKLRGAVTSGTALLVVGAGNEPFTSTWNSDHFGDIPRPD